ncbi:MAG: ABC transporter ATP-binding protein [Anaerolineae bacterium]|nr:ABC transporter ATP-binding protein [Anaerolineae bacterium]
METKDTTVSLFKPVEKKSETIALQLKSLTKTFVTKDTPQIAVNDIDLKIRQGEFLTLLGPSGCGKTTTLRLVAGFEFPTAGQVILDGQVINNVPPNKRPMAMVFQGFALFPHMSVFDNIAYGLRVKRLSKDLIKERVEIAMSLMNLVGMENRMPHQMSGGQQQRVALARALVMQPRVLLFDEPLSNLDAKLRVQMRTEIRRLQKRLGITSLYVTHDQSEAMGLSDRIVVMNNGKIEQVATPAEIYTKPASVFVADFVGQSNFIKSTVLTDADGKLGLDFFGKSISLTFNGHSFIRGEAVYLVIRPEAVQLRRSQETEASLEGEIKQAEYLGSHVEYEVEVQGGYFVSVTNYNPRFEELRQEGDRVFLHFPPDAFHVLPQSW